MGADDDSAIYLAGHAPQTVGNKLAGLGPNILSAAKGIGESVNDDQLRAALLDLFNKRIVEVRRLADVLAGGFDKDVIFTDAGAEVLGLVTVHCYAELEIYRFLREQDVVLIILAKKAIGLAGVDV